MSSRAALFQGGGMSRVVLYVSTSVDGFITGPGVQHLRYRVRTEG
jgi:hypothetical protein